MTQEQTITGKDKKAICLCLAMEMENRGTNIRELLGIIRPTMYTEKTPTDKVKNIIRQYWWTMKNSGSGDLETIYIISALLKIDACERFPKLKGQPRKGNNRNEPATLTEGASKEQLYTLNKLGEELGIKIYCTSKWGAWIVINNFMPQPNEESKEEESEITKLKAFIDERERLIGKATCLIDGLKSDLERWKREWLDGRKRLAGIQEE